VRKERLDRIDRLWLDGPADLAIEFLIEQTARTDQILKLHEYEQAGVSEYAMIETRDDRDGLTLYRLTADGRYQQVVTDDRGRCHSAVLPGFWFDPDWFRQDPLPIPEDLMFEIAPDAYDAWLLSRRRVRRDHGSSEWVPVGAEGPPTNPAQGTVDSPQERTAARRTRRAAGPSFN
jgi:Putative restriction endonuclease